MDFGAVLGGKNEGRIRLPAKQNKAPRLTKMDRRPFYVPFSLVGVREVDVVFSFFVVGSRKIYFVMNLIVQNLTDLAVTPIGVCVVRKCPQECPRHQRGQRCQGRQGYQTKARKKG